MLGVVEKEVNKHPHKTESFSLMEAVVRAMEYINKGHLIKAYSHLWTRTELGLKTIFPQVLAKRNAVMKMEIMPPPIEKLV
ncbi:hypothetical protein ACTXT7_011994 [Hymenolepis weldensis]